MSQPASLPAFLLSGLLTVSVLLPPAARSRIPHNVLLVAGAAESSIARNAKHPKQILIASNAFATRHGVSAAGYYTSSNGGRSFVTRAMPVRNPYTYEGDPSVALDDSSVAYFSFLGEAPAHYSCNGCTCKGSKRSASILVAHSARGKLALGSPAMVSADSEDDKPYMTVRSAAGHASHVYVAWTRGTAVWFDRSTNGGNSFSRPRMLYGSYNGNYGPIPLVDSLGRVYVFWTETNYGKKGNDFLGTSVVREALSLDDGKHFAAPQNITGKFKSPPLLSEPGDLRVPPEVSVDADRHGGIYATWAKATHRAGTRVTEDIELSRSLDGGKTWSRPLAVNDRHNGDRFMPSLSVLRDGSVGLAFYDRRSTPAFLDVYAAHVSFAPSLLVHSNLRIDKVRTRASLLEYVKPGECQSPGHFFGDYLGAVAIGNFLGVTWTSSDVKNSSKLWYTQVRLR